MSLPRKRKSAIRSWKVKEQGWRCFYCRRPMWLLEWTPDEKMVWREGLGLTKKQCVGMYATIEHLEKREHGGTDRLDNLAIACFACNSSRENASVEDWIAVRSALFAGWYEMMIEENVKNGYTPAIRLQEAIGTEAQATGAGAGGERRTTGGHQGDLSQTEARGA